MSTIITRAGKGSPLTNDEVDANFNNLNSTKLETSAVGTLSTQNANSVAITGGAINGTSITVTDNVFTLQDNVDSTKQAQFQLSAIGTGVTATYTMPAATGTIAALNATQTFTAVNTFTASFNTFGASTITGTQAFGTGATTSGNTKTVNIGTGGLSGSTTNITVGSANGSTTTMLGTTVIGGAAGNQSLQVNNVASAVNYAQIVGAITGAAPTISAQGSDANISLVLSGKGTGVVALGGSTVANSGLQVGTTTSAVNFMQVLGAPTGGSANFQSKGTDANIGMDLVTKGTGIFRFYTQSFGVTQLRITDTPSAVNFLDITGAVTTGAPEIIARGSDTNINLKLTTKGTGVLQFGTYTAGILTPTGYITITDAGGTSRRLLVG